MRTLLLAHGSDDLRSILERMLSETYRVTSCGDGLAALALLDTLRPDILVLDLHLPRVDGLAILEQAAEYLPAVVLAVTVQPSDYSQAACLELGAGYLMSIPCDIRNLCSRIDHMATHISPESRHKDTQKKTTALRLRELGFTASQDGYTQLRAAIPMFAQDPVQTLSKELYPTIAKLYGYSSGTSVEKGIRGAIKAAWMQRDDAALWQKYFPSSSVSCPTNKLFIATLAELLENP